MKAPASGFSLSRTFASLGYPNYRLWFAGQLVSLFGTWMQTTALGFYVFDLTRSKSLLGVVAFATGLPTILFMIFGGFVADRIPKRRLILLSQTALMAFAFALSVLTFMGKAEVWLIVLIAVLNGIATAFDAPARQSFVLEMVDRSVLTNAIALNSMMFNAATAIGPAIGGVTYALFGPGWCFAINGFSYLAVILALLLMKLGPEIQAQGNGNPLAEIADGFRQTFGNPRILLLVTIVAFVSFFGFSVFTLFPAWAVNVLGGGSTTNGFLQSARGVGALTSALIIASIGNSPQRGRLLRLGTISFPVALLVFAFVTNEAVSLTLIFLAGMGLMFVFNLANAMVQVSVKDEIRGRVMGIYSLIFFGFNALGSLTLGFLSDLFDAQAVITASSVVLVAFSVIAFRVAKAAKVTLVMR